MKNKLTLKMKGVAFPEGNNIRKIQCRNTIIISQFNNNFVPIM